MPIKIARRKKKQQKSSEPIQLNPLKLIPYRTLRDVLLVALPALSVYLTVAYFSSWGGIVGKELRYFLTAWFGAARYVCLILPLVIAVFVLDPNRKPTWLHFIYAICWFISIVLFFDILGFGGNSILMADPLFRFFGKGGAFIFSWTFLTVATILITDISLSYVFGMLKRAALLPVRLLQKAASTPALTEMRAAELQAGASSPIMVEQSEAEQAAPPEPSAQNPIVKVVVRQEEIIEPIEEDEEEVESAPQTAMVAIPRSAPIKIKREIKDVNGYKLPGLSVLEDAEPKRDRGPRIEPSDYSRLLEETLRNFGVEAAVLHVERGPTVTRYELQPAKGVKVSKIVALADDIALALAATSLRIEAPIPGKSAIGIEVPNSSVAMVYFRDILSSKIYQDNPQKMILALGKDITGQPIFTDLKRMPHLLIAGATGSGKTVCINTLIASILFRATPEEVQFVMIDPKRVELTIYDGIPHLVQEVVTDPKQAAKVLMDVLVIMDERYGWFKEARVRNLEEYNKVRPEAPLPYIVVLIDELADLMMLAAAMVESSISRLTALARAAGIHLIVATQRPSVDVITGIIKANIPSRVAFAVSSIADSRTILDTGGAEKLLGRGDMLFAPIDAMKPVRLQGAYVSLNEIEALVSFWSKQHAPENRVNFPELAEEVVEQELAGDADELYPQAKEVILRTGQASVSTLQRKLKIGYARAGRLMDIMEEHGVVGPADGAKPRKILIPNPFRRLSD